VKPWFANGRPFASKGAARHAGSKTNQGTSRQVVPSSAGLKDPKPATRDLSIGITPHRNSPSFNLFCVSILSSFPVGSHRVHRLLKLLLSQRGQVSGVAIEPVSIFPAFVDWQVGFRGPLDHWTIEFLLKLDPCVALLMRWARPNPRLKKKNFNNK
jgi:hypothetical protein